MDAENEQIWVVFRKRFRKSSAYAGLKIYNTLDKNIKLNL